MAGASRSKRESGRTLLQLRRQCSRQCLERVGVVNCAFYSPLEKTVGPSFCFASLAYVKANALCSNYSATGKMLPIPKPNLKQISHSSLGLIFSLIVLPPSLKPDV
jgi:hypothetical protein